jgi:hypothetical protein
MVRDQSFSGKLAGEVHGGRVGAAPDTATCRSYTAPRSTEAAMVEGSCHCGAVRWRFSRVPEDATACNCTACRRYGALWAYDYEGEAIEVSGPTRAYVRGDSLAFHFCAECGCVAYWRGLHPGEDGRRRIAVNLRLADPAQIGHVVLDHFDGLDTFTDLGRDGRCVRDLWF